MRLANRRVWLGAGVVLLSAGLVAAQPLAPQTPLLGPQALSTYSSAVSPSLQGSDAQALEEILRSARSGEGERIRPLMAYLTDPVAREIGLWALVDTAPASLTFQEADRARRELVGWPHEARRRIAAENLLDRSGLSAAQIIAWFGASPPQTARGAMALAGALRATGQSAASANLIRTVWRTMVFDEDSQEAMLAGFAGALTVDDHIAREDLLLYGPQGPAAQDMLRLLPPDQQALAQARMAVRKGSVDAMTLVEALPAGLQNAPGLAYERALRYREDGQTSAALSEIPYLPRSFPLESAGEKLWRHGALVVAALQAGDVRGAYEVAARSGLGSGAEAAEAEFYAGWIALSRLKDPRLADAHFARLLTIGRSPLTQSRGFYWRGRAAEAMGDPVAAQVNYGQGARFVTTFYGQLAAAKAGIVQITLPKDPPVTSADRTRFEGYAVVRAARMLAELGDRAAFKAFVADLSEVLPSAVDEAQLVDLARDFGDQEVSMRVVRNAAKRDFILPERGYPITFPPLVGGAPETPFVLGVVRQESSFDPRARSGAGARGMMQLMPATAAVIARRIGVSYSPEELEDPSYNMELGSAYLGRLVGDFSGSYVMAAAAYNAGPGRPNEWAAACGDPRATATDPLDFIECIPFSETRDYVMRVMEATQVYRARLRGGAAPLTLAQDLKRGAYAYTFVPPAAPTVISLSRPAVASP
ncbi:MAG: lytic transglycosylase domain-containing protein [Caulobacteraceae bacterium]